MIALPKVGLKAAAVAVAGPVGGFFASVPRWVWIALGAVLVAAAAYWFAYSRGEAAGEAKVQAKWDAQKLVDAAAAAKQSAEWQKDRDAAATARAERDRIYQAARRPVTVEVQNYATSPAAAARCPDRVGVQAGAAAIEAANAALTAR